MCAIFLRKFSFLILLSLFLLPFALHAKENSLDDLPLPATDQSDSAQEQYADLMEQGLFALMEDKIEAAIQLFNQALKINPGDPAAKKAIESAKNKLSFNKVDLKDKNKKDFRNAKEHYSRRQYLLSALIAQDILNRSPDYKKAQKLIESIQKKAEKNIPPHPARTVHFLDAQALLYFTESKWGSASICLDQLIEINPKDSISEMARNRIQQLIAHYPSQDQSQNNSVCNHLPEPVKKTDPDFLQLYSALKQSASEKQADPVKLSEELKPPEKIPQDTPNQESQKNVLPKKEKTLEKPEQEQKKEAQENPIEKVRQLVLAGRLLPAIQILELIIKQEPKNSQALVLLANAQVQTKKMAQQYYRQGLKAFASGNRAAAYDYLRKTLILDPEHAKAKTVLLRNFFRESK